MTAMPQMVALFNGVGGGAVALIAWVGYRHAFGGDWALRVSAFELFGAIVGSISFWGSAIAFGKLQEILPGRPIKLPGAAQSVLNLLLFTIAVVSAVVLAAGTHSQALFILGILVTSAVLGVMLVLPIGGADMPVVISLLERVHGIVGGGDRRGPEQPGDDRGRDDRRRVGNDPHRSDGQGDEPLGARDRGRRLRRRGGRPGRAGV